MPSCRMVRATLAAYQLPASLFYDGCVTSHFCVPDSASQVLIGVNPRAGASDRRAVIAEFVRCLAQRDYEAALFEDVGQLAAEAQRLLANGELRAVVAAGGDGTIRLMAQSTPVGTPILAMPLGTENLLARYLTLSSDPAELAQVVADGNCVRLDAGLADGRLFTLMAGCGFDADVVHRLHQQRDGHIHHLSYAKPILDAVRTYDYPELRVYCAPADAAEGEDLSIEIAARWVFVVNLPRYARGLSFAPSASGSDGLIDVCTFKEGSLWYGLLYLGGVMLGQHENMSDFQHVQTRRVRIEAAGKATYQLDGDPGGELPVEITCVPQRLTLMVPRSWKEHA